MQPEFVIHGVPQGHQSWGTTSDKYYETFYGKYDIYAKAKTVFVVEVRDNPRVRSCYYTLIHPQNVLAAGGRQGSYFGMSLRFDGRYCTDVFSLFHLFEIAFNQYIASQVIKKVGESEQFTVEDLNTVAPSLVEAKKYILSQIQNHLSTEFEEIDETFTKKNVQLNEYYHPDDINSESFFKSTRLDGKVLISSEYPTKDAIIRSYRAKDKQTHDSKKADEERIDTLTKENSSLKQYKDAAISLKSEVSKLREDNQRLSGDLTDARQSTASLNRQLTSYKSQIEQIKDSANIQKIAGQLNKSMSELLPILRTIAPETGNEHENHGKTPHGRHPVRDNSFFKGIVIVLIVLIVLIIGILFFLIKGIKSGPKISELKKENTSLVQKNKSLQDDYDKLWKDYSEIKVQTSGNIHNVNSADWPNLKIDVKNYNGGSELDQGKSYSVQIIGFDGTGKWIGEGFEIVEGQANDKTIKVKPNRSGEIYLRYKVDNQIVKERKFWAK